jgi:hypothetical protein
MATKKQELEAWKRFEAGREPPSSCLAKAEHDEPLFILRAKDPLAAPLVRQWAQMARNMAQHEPAKADEAIKLAEAMEAWRSARFPPVVWVPGDE